MDYMLDIATRFLAAERQGVVFKQSFLASITEAIGDLKEDPLIWHWRDERSRDLLAAVFYARPEIAKALTNPDQSSSVVESLGPVEKLDLYPAFLKELAEALTPEARKGNGLPTSDAELRHELIGNPKLVSRLAKELDLAIPFSLVLESELAEICRSRSKRLESDYDAEAAQLLKTLKQAERSITVLTRVGYEPTQCEPAGKSGEEVVKTPRASDADEIQRLEISAQEAREKLEQIERLRQSHLESPPNPPAPDDSNSGPSVYPLRRAQDFQLVGLALSGGGIRSATFNLGVLQGMADLDLLRKVDYLSAVSGGSYIASWLASWCKREPYGIRRVQRWLSPTRSPDPEAETTHPIWFLRQYSNYLTPKTGFFKADTWTLISIWLRNTLLNQTVLILGMAALLLVPRWLYLFTQYVGSVPSRLPQVVIPILAMVAVLLLLWAGNNIGKNLRAFEREPAPSDRGPGPPESNGQSARKSRPMAQGRATQGRIQWTIVFPTMLVGVLGTALLLWWKAGHTQPEVVGGIWDRRIWHPALTSMFVITAGLWLAQMRSGYWGCFYQDQRNPVRGEIRAGLFVLLFCLISGLGGGLLIAAMLGLYFTWPLGPLQAAVFGPALLIVVLSLTLVLHIGLMGFNLPDERREWWSRLGAWLLIYSLGWTAMAAVALYGPWLLLWAGKRISAAGGVVWVFTTLWGLWRGYSPNTPAATGSEPEPAESRLDLVTKVAPYVFIIGLLLLLSFALHRLLLGLANQWPGYKTLTDNFLLFAQPDAGKWTFGLFLIAALLCMGLAVRFDVNEFSMHHFYRNRLTRCYLGATRPKGERRPNPFTGFDYQDDFKFKDLCVNPGPAHGEAGKPYLGPYLIVNTALNLVAGKELAWQERKAESFVFTPLYCGYEYRQADGDAPAPSKQTEKNPESAKASKRDLTLYGYRPTSEFAYQHGPAVGTAVGISGAAVSPNMGYHSSPALSFLMTLFNVRLGWWMGNTRHQKTWKNSSPFYGLFYLVWELIGNTNDTSQYVNLSDGGHFENLGIYELVRRRCRYIIACDAEEDHGFTFGGLGNAIRKCRTDLGVNIDVDLHQVRPLTIPGKSRAHCVVGEINYPGGFRGKLLYIKTSLTDDEPPDVFEYSLRERLFPHQSTADQFFDESQFESYRALGWHVSTTILTRPVRSATQGSRTHLERLFDYLLAMWYPHTPAMVETGPRHTEAYDELLDKLREDPDLANLDAQFFPAVPDLVPPAVGERGKLYVAALMIQLMHSVFRDLNLESQQDHPHSEGWMRIFRRWAATPAVRDAWSVVRPTYGIRFRNFYDVELTPKS